jgi:hypothetical protein
MNGWEAGIRTPIGRSGVVWKVNQIKQLALQNKNNSGRIRNATAMNRVKAPGLGTESSLRIEASLACLGPDPLS